MRHFGGGTKKGSWGQRWSGGERGLGSVYILGGGFIITMLGRAKGGEARERNPLRVWRGKKEGQRSGGGMLLWVCVQDTEL